MNQGNTVQAAISAATARLRAAGVEDPARDALRLMAHALGVDTSRVVLVMPDIAAADDREHYEALIARRAAREPVSKITGVRAFFGRDFEVTPEVLDPRPDTELVIEEALKIEWRDVLDLGTGSGAIIVSLLGARPNAKGVATDLSEAALKVAARNAARHGVDDRLEFLASDWFAGVGGRFDLIVSNPPYITEAELPGLAPEVVDWDPRIALSPGGDGLSAYRAISGQASEYLRAGGWLIVEIGPTQAADVMRLFDAAGLVDVRVVRDLNDRDRVVLGRNA